MLLFDASTLRRFDDDPDGTAPKTADLDVDVENTL
jgi:hypothetical protein